MLCLFRMTKSQLGILFQRCYYMDSYLVFHYQTLRPNKEYLRGDLSILNPDRLDLCHG